MEDRKITKSLLHKEKPYEVLKPSPNENPEETIWNHQGSKYTEKGIANFYHAFRKKYNWTFDPPALESQLEEIVRKRITENKKPVE